MENTNKQTDNNSFIDLTPYKIVYDNSPSAFALIHVLKVDGKYDDFVFEYANKGYEAMSGFTVEQLNGHTYSEICGKKNPQWNELYGKCAYEGKTASTIEYGAEIGRYVHIQSHQIQEGYCGIVVEDINKQMVAQKRLEKVFEQKYEIERQRNLHDKKLLAYGVFNLTKNETMELVRNRKLHPLDKNTDIQDFCEDIVKNIIGEEKQKEFRTIFDANTLISKHNEGIDEHIIEYQRRLPSGRVIWVFSRFFILTEPQTSDLILCYRCNDINDKKTLEDMVAFVSNSDYDMFGSVNFYDDSAIMLYGKNSLRHDNKHGWIREENYSEALEWFVQNAVVPEEREQFRTQLFIDRIKSKLTDTDTYEFLIHVIDKNGERLTKQIRYSNYNPETETCLFTQTDITKLITLQEEKQKILSNALIEAQKASEAKAALNEVPVGIGTYYIENGVSSLVQINDAYYKMLGFERQQRTQFLGTNHFSLNHPEDKEKISALIRKLVQGDNEASTLCRIKNCNGEWVWLKISAFVSQRIENKIKVYVAFIDCDELIRSRIEIQQSHKKIEALLSSIPGGVAVYRVKKDGRIPTDYVSDGLARICGYDGSEDILRFMGEDSRKLVLPEDYPIVASACKNSLETGAPTSVNYRVYGKDGTPVRITLDSVVMKDADLAEDDVAVFYAVQAPVSEYLIESEKEQNYYRTLLDMLGISYWEWSEANGFYTSENYSKYALSKRPLQEVQERKAIDDIIHPDDIPLLQKYFEENKSNNTHSNVTVRLKLTDGSYQWTEMFTIKEYSPEGKMIRMSGIMRNVNDEWIEQRNKLQTALDDATRANKAKTAFLSRVSHDMRTPLNGILGLVSIMRNNITDNDTLADLNELELSGKYLLNLINDTLDMSRIENDHLELHPVVFDGRTFFNTTIGLAKTAIESKHLHYKVHSDELPFSVLYADVARMQQVLMNVVSNAVKFTPEGGTIDINVKNVSVKDGVITDKFIISDTGIGMSPEFLPHLFETFSQEDASKTSSSQGTGLGMAITKKLLDLMDGDISVESELGKGSSFTITMKLQIATDEQIEKWKTEQPIVDNGYDFTDKRVLICEDHPLNSKIATKLLETKGIIVECAENGQIGVNMFAQSEPGYYDAILMDIRMPIMDGITASKTIRNLVHPDSKNIPIIAMTANAFSEDVEETKKAGMNAHLSKPIESGIMFKTLGELMKVNHTIKRPKLLVVDDTEVNRAVIVSSLEKDYDIYQAENGEKALEMIKKIRGLDAVITDIQMPGMDGTELIKKIRSNKKYRHLVIIANTQYGDPGQEENLLALGANDFVYKPTTPKIVEMRVRNALNKVY